MVETWEGGDRGATADVRGAFGGGRQPERRAGGSWSTGGGRQDRGTGGDGAASKVTGYKNGVTQRSTSSRSRAWSFGLPPAPVPPSSTADPLRADLDSVLSAVIRRIEAAEEQKQTGRASGRWSPTWTPWQVPA